MDQRNTLTGDLMSIHTYYSNNVTASLDYLYSAIPSHCRQQKTRREMTLHVTVLILYKGFHEYVSRQKEL